MNRKISGQFTLLLILCVILCQRQEVELSYENPVRNSTDDRIISLPGLNSQINFTQYSGYLPVEDSDSPNKFLHYWFLESQSSPKDDPVLLWLNGGPGCSSMLGLFTELGPFLINDDGKTLRLNPYSWNKNANVLFLESPSSVGFSYSKAIINFYSDDITAKQNHNALRAFMKKFPQYSNNSLYMSGESYAGVYLPTLGQLVDKDRSLNLKGIAIGNGFLDAAKLKDSLIFFSYHHGFAGETSWNNLKQHCCNGRVPSRESCTFRGSTVGLRCRYAQLEVTSFQGSGINPYNVYDKCYNGEKESNWTTNNRRSLIDRGLTMLAFNENHTISDLKPFHVFDTIELEKTAKVKLGPPCTDDHLIHSYLNNPSVREAIHIPHKVGDWESCSLMAYVMQYPTKDGGLAPQIKSLMASKRNLTLMIYNGDVDSVCNFLGDEWFVDDLKAELIEDYKPWKVDGQVAGFFKVYKGITYVTLRGSGHMVPGDKPKESLFMIEAFLRASKDRAIMLT